MSVLQIITFLPFTIGKLRDEGLCIVSRVRSRVLQVWEQPLILLLLLPLSVYSSLLVLLVYRSYWIPCFPLATCSSWIFFLLKGAKKRSTILHDLQRRDNGVKIDLTYSTDILMILSMQRGTPTYILLITDKDWRRCQSQ